MDQEISWLLTEVRAPGGRLKAAVMWKDRASVVKELGADPIVASSSHEEQDSLGNWAEIKSETAFWYLRRMEVKIGHFQGSKKEVDWPGIFIFPLLHTVSSNGTDWRAIPGDNLLQVQQE